ncbi:MAG: carbamoyltransferase [Pseudonocardiales bacterium]|nr:carbamoyltransferase [Pseudonocardiales bacterium]
MLVLGITNNDGAGACLIEGGTIVAAASEERFTRVKEHRTWPARAIDFVLKHRGVRLDDLDHVAYGWCAGFDAEKHLLTYFDRIVDEAARHPGGLPHLRKRISDEIANDKEKRGEFDAWVEANGLQAKVVLVDHHDAHALGGFVCSPFDDALVVTCDGRGDFQSLTVRHISPRGERVLQREVSADSLGYFYGRITKLLGFTPNRHEGKITGLAASGDPDRLRPLMRRMIDLVDGKLRATTGDYFQPSYDGYSEELLAAIAAEPPADVAAAAQAHVEQLLTDLVRPHIAATGARNVCLSGGVFGNVKLNQRVLELDGVDNVYVVPPMGDAGLPLHAAVAVGYQRGGFRAQVPSMALGPDAAMTERGLREHLRDYPKLSCLAEVDTAALVLEALAANQVVGVYRGRMEYGPRSLGKRSIIYRADDPSMNDWLNDRLRRTEFMPFAPITAEDLAGDCYRGWRPDHVSARFMTITYDCTDAFSEACPAVVHVDGTARPQVVRAQDDPYLHGLLMSWHEKTGQAALVNTSFNKHEEPILGSPSDAFDALDDEIVDLLVVDDSFVLWKEGASTFMSGTR